MGGQFAEAVFYLCVAAVVGLLIFKIADCEMDQRKRFEECAKTKSVQECRCIVNNNWESCN